MPEVEPKIEECRENGVSRIIGFSEENIKEIEERFKDVFENPIEDDILKAKREKTEGEKNMISEILEKMPDFITKYGGIALRVPLKNIYIIDGNRLSDEGKKEVEKTENAGGAYCISMQNLYIMDSGNTLKNAHRIVHELIHFNSFQSIELRDSKEKTYGIRRVGFEIHSKRNKTIYFNGINEAITEELHKRFDNEFFDNISLIAEDVKHRNDIRKHAKGKGEDISLIVTKQLDSGEWHSTVENYVYAKERKELKKVIQKIYDENKNQFNSPEDVFNIFAKAAMNGKLLKAAKLIKRTYGKGSFKKLGETTQKK